MRADRLLSILLLLQMQQRITARELSKRLEVSERTIHRDMEALSTAGIPVTAERGINGGWSLLEAYRTNLTGLNEAEIHALFLTQPNRLLTDLGLHKAADAAIIKLLAALPSISRRDAEYVHQRIYIDPASWHPTEENISSLATLQKAVLQERKLLFTYQRDGNSTFERQVDPLGLVAKGSTWYLIAAIEGEIRSYRVSRIQTARVLDEPCLRPHDFDLADYWAQSSTRFVANLPRYRVTVRIAPELLEHIYHAGRYAKIESTDPPDVNGWLLLRLQFEMEESACGYLLSFGPRVDIIEPVELRDKVIELAKSVVEFYEEQMSEQSH
jgi:predicted DNA-binding transcriptional regulator YafY